MGRNEQKGNKIYVHVLNWQDLRLHFQNLEKKLLAPEFSGSSVKFLENDFGLSLQILKEKMMT